MLCLQQESARWVGPKWPFRLVNKFASHKTKTSHKFFDPISTLPEHLHSTLLSHAKTTGYLKTHETKGNFSFPLYRSLPVSQSPTPPYTPFTGSPSHTHSYLSFLFLVPRKSHVLLAAVTLLSFFNPIRIKATGVYFDLTLLTFSDSYLNIYQYVVHFTYFTVKMVGGGQ